MVLATIAAPPRPMQQSARIGVRTVFKARSQFVISTLPCIDRIVTSDAAAPRCWRLSDAGVWVGSSSCLGRDGSEPADSTGDLTYLTEVPESANGTNLVAAERAVPSHGPAGRVRLDGRSWGAGGERGSVPVWAEPHTS